MQSVTVCHFISCLALFSPSFPTQPQVWVFTSNSCTFFFKDWVEQFKNFDDPCTRMCSVTIIHFIATYLLPVYEGAWCDKFPVFAPYYLFLQEGVVWRWAILLPYRSDLYKKVHGGTNYQFFFGSIFLTCTRRFGMWPCTIWPTVDVHRP